MRITQNSFTLLVGNIKKVKQGGDIYDAICLLILTSSSPFFARYSYYKKKHLKKNSATTPHLPRKSKQIWWPTWVWRRRGHTFPIFIVVDINRLMVTHAVTYVKFIQEQSSDAPVFTGKLTPHLSFCFFTIWYSCIDSVHEAKLVIYPLGVFW